jgi:urea transport system permease protein
MGKLCGDAASLGDAGRAFVGIAADGSQDERAWATPVARAVIDRKADLRYEGRGGDFK